MSSFGDFLNNHSPEIMTGASIIGFATTIALVIKATPTASEVVDDARAAIAEAIEEDKYEDVSQIKKITVKELGKLYLPAIVSGAATVACVIGSNRVSSGRQAALATAYTMSNKALLDYQEEVRNSFGPKKEEEVRRKVAKKQYTESNSPLYLVTEGDYLMYDKFIGKKFMGTQQKFNDAVIDANIHMVNNDEVTMEYLYSQMGIYDIPEANAMKRWCIENGKIEVYYDHDIDESGRPMIIFDYVAKPK